MPAASLYSSAGQEHFTPGDITERIRYVFDGSIDLDPASCQQANTIVKAERYYSDPFPTPEDDQAHLNDPRHIGYGGLYHPQTRTARVWTCRSLWLNPPFSVDKRDEAGAIVYNDNSKPIRERVIDEWVARWCEAVDTREAAQGAILVPARTDTEWFQLLWGYSMCFITGRLKFSDAKNSAPFPTVVVYAGVNLARFYTVFEPIGQCGQLIQTGCTLV
jgi:hypothetical protein